jgi:hypothetical protein
MERREPAIGLLAAVRSGRGGKEDCTKVKGRKRARKMVKLRWCMAVVELWLGVD